MIASQISGEKLREGRTGKGKLSPAYNQQVLAYEVLRRQADQRRGKNRNGLGTNTTKERRWFKKIKQRSAQVH